MSKKLFIVSVVLLAATMPVLSSTIYDFGGKDQHISVPMTCSTLEGFNKFQNNSDWVPMAIGEYAHNKDTSVIHYLLNRTKDGQKQNWMITVHVNKKKDRACLLSAAYDVAINNKWGEEEDNSP